MRLEGARHPIANCQPRVDSSTPLYSKEGSEEEMKPGLTVKPDRPVTPKNKVKGITIELGLSDKSTLRLRAIAKHCEALANELDAIDNECIDLPTRLEGSE